MAKALGALHAAIFAFELGLRKIILERMPSKLLSISHKVLYHGIVQGSSFLMLNNTSHSATHMLAKSSLDLVEDVVDMEDYPHVFYPSFDEGFIDKRCYFLSKKKKKERKNCNFIKTYSFIVFILVGTCSIHNERILMNRKALQNSLKMKE